MSSPVHSVSSTSQKPARDPSSARPRARKGSDPVSFSRVLQGPPGPGRHTGPVAGKKTALRGPAPGAHSPSPEKRPTGPLPPPPVHAREARHEGHSHHHRDAGRAGALLDPLVRSFAHGQLAHLAAAPPPGALPPNPTLVHLDQMMTKLVRKVAWGGDGERGAARIELGAGELAGATIVVQSENGALSVDVELPPGTAADVWRERLEKRFKGRGFNLVELNVR